MKSRWEPYSLVAAAALILMACEPGGARLLRHPYLQAVTPHSAAVIWRTEGRATPVLRYGREADRLDQTVAAEKIAVRTTGSTGDASAKALHSAPASCFQYEAVLDGLEPDTVYFYAVCDGPTVLAGGDAAHTLHTSPGPDFHGTLRFWVVGDTGMGNAEQRSVFAAMQKTVAAEGVPVDGILHLGDMAYFSGTDAEFQDHFFAPYQELLQRTVCWPTMGNHEGITSRSDSATGPYYDAFAPPTAGEAGGVPSGTEAYYSFDVGPVHLVSLNSHDVSRARGGEMARWLEKDLAAAASARWLVAFCHHPPYSKGSHDSDLERPMVELREQLVPLLEEAGLDLFLAGHSHTYERSQLIDGMVGPSGAPGGAVLDDGDGDPEGDGTYRKSPGRGPHQGTVAVVVGTGGGALGRRGTSPVMRSTLETYGSLLLDVSEDRLSARMVDADGVVRDRFAIDKSAAVTPHAVEHPWQPFGPGILDARTSLTAPLQVTLVASPTAPDAVVHYTLDGEAPGPSSPAYTSTFPLHESAQVQAVTTWDGGRRVSPVASRWVEVLPASAQRCRVQRSEDDAVQRSDGAVLVDGAELAWKDDAVELVGLRFEFLLFPPGTQIRQAFLQLAALRPGPGEAALTLRAELLPGPSAFRAAPEDLSQRSTTEAAVDWELERWEHPGDRGASQRSPDLSALLQEVIDQEGWKPGNPLVILMAPAGARSACSFDGDPALAPELSVACVPTTSAGSER